ncbi:MAG: dockerin type I repeat-containing protein, partial [Clostridia bacterium]|nr:dockerin type I repeat-containing protein [Clostridia bacterium]
QNPPSPSVAYPIHPNSKRQPGERAAMMALHNLYGVGNADCYAPTVGSYTVQDDAIFITFDHVAGGLTTLNSSKGVHGFTIAGEDKLYAPAHGMIVNQNTVKIWNDGIAHPSRFTYAFTSHAQTANLCNSYSLPAVPYRSHNTDNTFFGSNDWLYCEDTAVFVNTGLQGTFEPTWQASHLGETVGEITVDRSDYFEGVGAICLSYQTQGKTSVGAAADFGYHQMPCSLYRYQYLSVMLKNKDNREKIVRLMVGLKDSEEAWSLPAETGTEFLEYTVTVPANSEFTRYTFRITGGLGYNTDAATPLTQLSRLVLMVEDSADGSLLIDDITLGTQLPGQQIPLPDEKPSVTYGDVNVDEVVDAKDALHILQNAVGKREFTQLQFTAGDVDGNETIDAKDALLVLKKAVKKIDRFPAEN